MAVTPNYGWPVPVATDYVKDGWEAISDLGNAIDTTVAGLGSGLTLVSTSNPSAASSVSFTNLVVGKRYRVLGNITTGSSSTSGEFIFKFRENTTDKSTGYYGGAWYTNHTGGSGVAASYNNGSTTYLGSIYTGSVNNFVYDIFVVSLSLGIANGLIWDDANVRQMSTSFKNSGMSNFNGFSVYPNTGTMTGKIALYEYE